MSQHRTLETLVRESLEVEPSAAERDAVWQSITERLGEETRPGRIRRLPRLAAVGLAAAAISVATITLLATTDKPGSLLPATSDAEAAAILRATATRARGAAPAVGPSQYLFARTVSDVTGDGAVRLDTKSWAAIDGSAWIVARERSSRGLERSTTRYRAGRDVALVREGGVTTRSAPDPLSNWRSIVPGDEVARLPADRDRLLATLRTGVERAARRLQELSERPPGEQPGGVRNHYPALAQIELSGPDLFVIEAVTDLLMWAPLAPDQRARLLSLLADIREWYRPGTSATPIHIRTLGPAEDALGRTGTVVRIATEPTPDEAARAGGWLVDLVLDPDAGRVLETRSYEHGPNADPVRETLEAQRVVDEIPRGG